MIGLPHANPKKQAIAMYHTTGFTSDELIDICVLITSVDREPGAATWPPCLGLLNSVVATLAYLRHNRTQVEIGESLGVSQPTISRAITVKHRCFPKPWPSTLRPPTTSTRKPSTSWTEHCFPAGHGTDARNSTQGSTRQPE